MSIFFTQKEAMDYLNISRMTLLRWEEKGLLTPQKTGGGHRRYLKEDLNRLIGLKNRNTSTQEQKIGLIYARVSTKKQAETGNLERQTQRLTDYCIENDIQIQNTYSEIGSGINENRKQLQRLLKQIKNEPIDYLVIEYKDRLARFGYRYLEQYCQSHGVEIIKLEEQETNINEEMVQDMMSIITSFSARMYGRRGAKEIKRKMREMSK